MDETRVPLQPRPPKDVAKRGQKVRCQTSGQRHMAYYKGRNNGMERNETNVDVYTHTQKHDIALHNDGIIAVNNKDNHYQIVLHSQLKMKTIITKIVTKTNKKIIKFKFRQQCQKLE